MVVLGFYHKVKILHWKLHLVVEQQAMVMVGKVVVLYHLMVIILLQKELHLVGGVEAIVHLTIALGHQIKIIVSCLSRRQMYYLLLMMTNALNK